MSVIMCASFHMMDLCYDGDILRGIWNLMMQCAYMYTLSTWITIYFICYTSVNNFVNLRYCILLFKMLCSKLLIMQYLQFIYQLISVCPHLKFTPLPSPSQPTFFASQAMTTWHVLYHLWIRSLKLDLSPRFDLQNIWYGCWMLLPIIVILLSNIFMHLFRLLVHSFILLNLKCPRPHFD